MRLDLPAPVLPTMPTLLPPRIYVHQFKTWINKIRLGRGKNRVVPTKVKGI